MAADGETLDRETLDKAEAAIAGLKGAYLDWVAGDLRQLDVLCGEARAAAPGQRPALMRRIFAVAHDIKGQGGSFGYDLMTSVGDLLCRFLESREVFSDEALAVTIDLADALGRIVGETMEGDGGETGRALLREARARIAAVD